MTHPTSSLDDVVHQRTRLGILLVLAEADAVDFVFLRHTLDLTAGNLSRHLSVLADAGFALVDKKNAAGKTRTWVSITENGRISLVKELATLRDIVARAEKAVGRSRGQGEA
ncbi:DNA-binding MarR family transcriptional regulator [Rhodococcus sp. 27YEA15]|uniref:transcriptional regulator n=1 Tax=Rhodococcus sp. 27YEA15 TaxID=3156259 RepID=UPI003C7C0B5C